MTKNTEQPDIAKIHDLLLAAFTVEELDRLFRFSSNPQFQNVAKEFSPGDGLTIMADKAISYCQRYLLLPDLLAEVRRANPRQYAQFIEPAPPTPELAPSASDRDTTTGPPNREAKKPPEEEPVRPAAELSTVTIDPAPEIKKPPDDGPAELTVEIPTLLGPIPLHLVRVPAGEFVMGGVLAKDKDAEENELPPHRVDLPEFHIGRYLVTNRQYQAFVQATERRAPKHWERRRVIPPGKEDHPVVHVSWRDAVAFCDWLRGETKQPFRLPTEAEWEKAARGTDGRIYPWGDDPPDKDRCNFNTNIGDTTAIGRYSPQGDSPYGCADMAGNVYEWCHSLYKPYPYHAGDGREGTGGLKAWLSLESRAVRGGYWASDPKCVRSAYRNWYFPGLRDFYDGFRVAMEPLG